MTRSIPLSQKETKWVQQMKESVQNTVTKYQKIYERKKRKEILKDSERWEERKDVRRITHASKLQRFTVSVHRHKNFFPLIWIIINNQKSHKLPFTWDLCRSYGTSLREFLIAFYLFLFRSGEIRKTRSFLHKEMWKKACFVSTTYRRFATNIPNDLHHAITPWETTAILHTRRQISCGVNINIPFFRFRIRTQNSDNSSTSSTIFLLKTRI